MPRFFFDIQNGGLSEDDVGREHPSAYAARDAAIVMLPLVARQEFPGGDCREVSVMMRDIAGTLLFKAVISLNTEWYASPTDADSMLAFNVEGSR